MPKKGLTDITYIIDKSGSMSNVIYDVIGGFNTFLKDQKEAPGEATMSLVMFSSDVQTPYAGVPISEVQDLDTKTYRTGGMTALLDAVMTAINQTGERLSAMPEKDRPEKVMVVIMTDGGENVSKFATTDMLASKIRHQEHKYLWNFVFMGANQDAFAEAGKLGIRQDMVANFKSTSVGTASAYESMSKGMLRARGSKGARVQGYFTPKG